MKFLNTVVRPIVYISTSLCASSTTGSINPHSFDTLYPQTDATYLIQQCMIAWQTLQDLCNEKNNVGNNTDSYEYTYAYTSLIGQLTHIADFLKSLQEKSGFLSDDTYRYCFHILNQMTQEASPLSQNKQALLYNRLIKQLNKIKQMLE